MRFKIGQKIVCIESSTAGLVNVIKGEIYTVERYSKNGLGVIVKEAVSQFVENGFWEHRFREIDDSWVEELLCKLIEEVEAEELVSA